MMFDVNTSFEILVGQCFKKSLLACLKLLLLGGLFMSFISHDKAWLAIQAQRESVIVSLTGWGNDDFSLKVPCCVWRIGIDEVWFWNIGKECCLSNCSCKGAVSCNKYNVPFGKEMVK